MLRYEECTHVSEILYGTAVHYDTVQTYVRMFIGVKTSRS